MCDDRPRLDCTDSGQILYANPKVIVGCVAEWEVRILQEVLKLGFLQAMRR
jgi:hypothetical protein